MLKEIVVNKEYFNCLDTLECGQIFRYFKVEEGYLVLSMNRACLVKEIGEKTVIVCNEEDGDYFYTYFDLPTDYTLIYSRAQNSGFEVLRRASTLGKGVRILRQNSEEMLFSFLISQNNNIPRIKKSINAICERLGEKKQFLGYDYYTFPTAKSIALQSVDFYKECGLGYRAEYIKIVAEVAMNGLIESLLPLTREQIKAELIKIKGIGEKVADCVCLFGFYKTDSFPVDTWIEKIYREDFSGKLTNRNKITEYFLSLFGYDSGYFQQYLFYYKRTLEKNSN